MFYFAKILFELSLSISRVTNFLELVNQAAMFVVIVTKVAEIVFKSSSDFKMTDANSFQDFSFLVSIERIYTISLGLCSFFYPFRCF